MANDDVWRLFVESLWRYQYTKTQVPLSQELSEALYHESAGIIDFAVKLFLLAQVRAISTGVEKITPAIIESVAKDSLRLAQPALHAIRTGDMGAVATMTDLHPIEFQSAVQEIRKAALLDKLSAGSRLVSDINAAAATPPTLGTPAPATTPGDGGKSAPALPAQSSSRPRRRKQAAGQSKCLLVQTVNAGLAKNSSAHDALAQVGLIKPLFHIQDSPK
jgi:hypothetical protein